MSTLRNVSLGVLLLGATAVRAADPDPIQLMRDAAAAVDSADSASVEVVVNTQLVRNDQVNDIATRFRFRTAAGGRFAFESIPTQGAPMVGYRVAGNGSVTLTAILGRGRHMLQSDEDGFAAFVRSPAVMGIGSGLGGLALAFLHPSAIEDLAQNVTDAAFVGEEEIEGERLLHARYTAPGGIVTNVWYQAEGEPLVRRVKPNVLGAPGVQDMASRYETFDYQLSFDFEGWNAQAGLTASDLPVVEPNGSLLVESLYAPPAGGPHALLGREAPSMTLPTPAGDKVDLSDSFGESVVLLEFWATDCPYCIKAMPALEQVEEDYTEKGLKYFAVNVGEDAEGVAAFLDQAGLSPTALLDEDGAMADAYEVGPIPLILLIGLDGKVQSATEGFSPTLREDLGRKVDALLAGDDLSAEVLQEWRQVKAARAAERKRLRALLDG